MGETYERFKKNNALSDISGSIGLEITFAYFFFQGRRVAQN